MAVYDNYEEQEYLNKEIALENRTVMESVSDNGEHPGIKKLKRELKAQALARLEDSARTVEDFNEVIQWWDRLDENREHKERYHEVSRGDNIPLDYGAADGGMYFPRRLNKSIRNQIQKGEFIEAIYNCPYEIHELISEPYLIDIIKELSDKQKELLYLIAIKGLSNSQIAAIRGQTDRNIRKVRDTMFRKIRKKAYENLTSEQKKQHDMTLTEKRFIKEYAEQIDKGK